MPKNLSLIIIYFVVFYFLTCFLLFFFIIRVRIEDFVLRQLFCLPSAVIRICRHREMISAVKTQI